MHRRTSFGSLALLALLTPVLPTPAGAENGFHDLTGEFYVVEEMEGMPPTMYVGLTGEAAQTLYESVALHL
jgi:hypothetical protein